VIQQAGKGCDPLKNLRETIDFYEPSSYKCVVEKQGRTKRNQVEYKVSAEFTQIELEQTAHRIDGYILQRPNESRESAFERAKSELIINLQRNIECAMEMSHDNLLYRLRLSKGKEM
jgi:hypothetical protein